MYREIHGGKSSKLPDASDSMSTHRENKNMTKTLLRNIICVNKNMTMSFAVHASLNVRTEKYMWGFLPCQDRQADLISMCCN